MAENIKVVRLDTQPAQTSLQELRKELKETRTIMLNAEEGTEEYNRALARSAEITHTLAEQTEQIRNAQRDFGQVANNCTKVVGGMVAGFQAAQAAMNLFGVENEDVLKSLQKMQSLMAMTQALPALEKGMKGFTGLRDAIAATTGATSKFGKALISTGLGAIIAALGYLIANFEDISKWLDEITGETDFLGNLSDKVLGGLQAGWAAIVQTLKAVGNAIITYVTTPFKGVVNAINAFTSTEGGMGDKLKAAAKAMKDGFVNDWKGVGDDFKKIGEVTVEAYNEGVKKANAKRTAESEKERKERLEREKKAAEEEARAVAEIKKRYASLEDEIRLYNASELEKQLDNYKKAQDSALKTLEDAHKKRLISDKQYEEEKLKVTKHYAELAQKAEEEANKKAAEDARNKTIKELETSYKLEQAQIQKQYKEGLISEEEFNEQKKKSMNSYVESYVAKLQYMLDTEKGLTKEQILDLTNRINEARELLETKDKKKDEESEEEKKLKAIKEGVNELATLMDSVAENPAWGDMVTTLMTIGDIFVDLKKKQEEFGADSTEYAKAATNAYMQVAAVGFNAMSQMFQGIAAEQDTSNKKGFETAKKMQIASATMTTLSSVLQALAAGNSMASQMGLAAPVGWALGAAMATMVGALGAVNIAKIAKQKFGGGGSTSTGSISTPSTSAVNSVIAPVQYTSDVQGSAIEGAIKDTKVYVTETDISDTQNKVSVTENEAKY